MRNVIGMLLIPLLGLTTKTQESRNDNSDSKRLLIQTKTDTKKGAGVTLKSAYKDYFPVGTAMFYHYLKNEELKKFVVSQYSSITCPDIKARTIYPREGIFDFSQTDSLVNFAYKNNLKIRGHCPIFYSTMPDWFFKENGKKVSKSLLLKRIDTLITTAMKRYKGKIYCWDIVNESIYGGNTMHRSNDRLYEILGEQYIEAAFRIAKKADPKTKLFYNDHFVTQEKRDKIFELLKRLKQKGVPIDGLGIQGHYGLNSFTEKSLKADLAKFKSIGLEIQFTEVDIAMFDRTSEKKYELGKQRIYSEDIIDKQAKQYEILFRVCREEPAVTGITLWGGADWPNFLSKRLKTSAYPYLFTEKMTPKKAFYSIINF
ncbi:endo-1,4-beta-xylanase [Dyadobacter sp. CY323]|uniref:endo-1,4-beta-xylanase n=1 Tax=Dyadobacter sp. CY323 TaxID=2907302 RepID=UPI001F2B2003|nr:endo-1,4-beta-xylanase [Dyadobacter sp. CY323]MCE6992746.1 endo-1,4-beta-xylanase [Dyadobacter sp. CY323]